MRKKGTVFWLYGLCLSRKSSFSEKKRIKKDVLEEVENKFFFKSTSGGQRTLRQFDHNFKHYPRVYFTTTQVLEICNLIQKQGYDLYSLDQIYADSPLTDFCFTIGSGNGNVGVILNRRPDVGYSGSCSKFDLAIDAYIYYTRKARSHLRISRMKYTAGSAEAALVYTEVMEPNDDKLKAINFYQDTGIKLYTIYIALQYAMLQESNILIPDAKSMRKRYLPVDPTSENGYKSYEEYELFDYFLGDASVIKVILLRRYLIAMTKLRDYSLRRIGRKRIDVVEKLSSVTLCLTVS